MVKLVFLMIIQSLFLTASQVFLKLGFSKLPDFNLSVNFVLTLLKSTKIWLAGFTMLGAAGIWFYVLKVFEFSLAYPLVSISYIFAMLAAVYIFNEEISVNRWLGVGLIIIGVFVVARS